MGGNTMVEKVVERGREPEPSELLYEFSFRYRAEYRKQRADKPLSQMGDGT